MKIYSLRHDAHNRSDTISFFDTVMYHGLSRQQSNEPIHGNNQTCTLDRECLCIKINIFSHAEVFIPIKCTNLVVSQRVLNALRPALKNVLIRKVSIEKIIYLPWQYGQRNMHPEYVSKLVDAGNELRIFDECHSVIDVDKTHLYYELYAVNHYQILKKYPPTGGFFSGSYVGKPHPDDIDPVCEDMYREYSITNAAYPIVTNEVYEILSNCMNHELFGISEYIFH